MRQILDLILRISALKRTARTGWNMTPPPPFKPRSVPDAESVADHSWSLALLALAAADELSLDGFKMVSMALVHDLAESVTTDIVVATIIDPEEKARVKALKRLAEDAAMQDIFSPLGDWGRRMYALWREYEDGTSEEARVLHELDKLEACIQAVVYEEAGHPADADQFLAYTEKILTNPNLRSMLLALSERRSPH